MMNIEIELSPQSIQSAIMQLKEYRDSLNNKNDLFVKKLAEIGIDVVEQRFNEADGADSTYHDNQLKIHSYGDYSEAVLSVSGTDVLFIEFGSGIRYNPTNPEHAEEFGYGVGTYPGQTHAFDPEGWWYRDSTGVPRHSYGTRATAPMLNAAKAIILQIREIAREVYGS